jgi:HK97 family phage major capsid protein
MVTIQQLREKIANLANQANHLLAEKGDQPWTAEEQGKFDNFATEIAAAKASIANIEKMRELDADKYFENAAGQQQQQQSQAGDTTISNLAAVALYMRFGNNVSAEQAVAIRNAMSTTTPGEGGYTVPAEVAAKVIERLKAFGGMREAATIITTETGHAMNFPTSDGTAEVGEIVAENAGATLGEITFGTTGLPVYKYSSKKIALPQELIQDSAIDVIAFVVARLATRIARIQNLHYTVGTGTNQPLGLIPAATVGKAGATGSTLTVAYGDLVDVKHSVNRAYRGNAKWMMNDQSVAAVSKIVDTVGRPIWVPAVTEGAPDLLLGKAIVTNDDVPAMAANAKSIAFGDFSQYTIRDVANSTTMRRFDDSAFALAGQVGFCGWTRSGGNLLDTAAVRLYQNSAT